MDELPNLNPVPAASVDDAPAPNLKPVAEDSEVDDDDVVDVVAVAPNLNPDPNVVSVEEVGAAEPNLNPAPVTDPDPKLGVGLKQEKCQKKYICREYARIECLSLEVG